MLRFDNKPAQGIEIDRMLTALNHRGPVSRITWTDGPVGLGQCSHSLSLNIPAVVDANIYESEDIGAPEQTQVLNAYEKYGEKTPSKLNGDFAFAVWDKHKQSLFLARDPFAIKPLFYILRPNFIAFASEIKALLALTEVTPRINEERMAYFFASRWADKHLTFHQDIFRLLPSHYAVINRDGLFKSNRHWEVSRTKETRFSSDAEYAETFLHLFRAAVKRRLPATGSVGTTLSGGLDSSSITAVTKTLMDERGDSRKLHAFSLIFSDRFETAYEEPYIQKMLAQYDLVHHPIPADSLSPLGCWDKMLTMEDEPPFQNTFYLLLAIVEGCKANGIKTLLDGMDGDAVAWHGIFKWYDLLRQGRLLELKKEVSGALSEGMGKMAAAKKVYRRALVPWMVAGMRKIKKMSLYSPVLSQPLNFPFLNPHFAKRVGMSDRIRSRVNMYIPEYYSTDRERHAAEMNMFRLTENMETIDRLAAHSGLDWRHPFFDKELVEFCVSLPIEQKNHYNSGRWAMRQAMRGLLPPSVQMRRTKATPQMFLNINFFQRDMGFIEKALLKNSSFAEKYVNIPLVLKLLKEWKENPNDACKGQRLWGAITATQWLASGRMSNEKEA